MNADIKNALEKVKSTCNEIEQKNGCKIWNVFLQDLYGFIIKISLKNEKERFDYFYKVYLGAPDKQDVNKIVYDCIPESIKMICSVQESREYARILVSFFVILGQYYLGNAFDRKDLNTDCIFLELKQMSTYISEKNDNELKRQNNSENKKMESTNQEAYKIESERCDLQREESVDEPEETLEELLEKLDSLIGLNGVKNEINQIINLIKVQKKGREFGEEMPPMSLHLVFYGNPGTGKTTVARLLGKIYKNLGVLSSGQMIEVDRGGLVAGYVGQTATKTQEVINKAMGGILFIDEAYTLTHGKGETDFGQEAVDTILKAMEDHRDDFIVIVAGYPDLMKEFIASNPGLKSRFNQFINFEDYKPDELLRIFELQCNTYNLNLETGCENYLVSYFGKLYENRSEDYANGRDVRNYFEKVIKTRANRLAKDLESISHDDFKTIIVADLEKAAKNETTSL